jgi:hypothetical protein
MWFFAPPRACTRLPWLTPVCWMYFAIGVEPTKDTACTSGCSSRASTASLSPCTTLKAPAGSPASRSSSAVSIDGRGVALGGLEDEGVAAGQRHRRHPHRHHEGKVEGRDAGRDAQRHALVPVVDAAADAVRMLALEQLRNAAGELDDFQPALHFAQCIGQGLAVLGAEQAGKIVRIFARPDRGT